MLTIIYYNKGYIYFLSILRAFCSSINYCSKSIDLAISFRWFSFGTPSTSSRNWGSRRGYLTFMLGIIGMTSKCTILCTSITTSTSIIRLGSLLKIEHIGTDLAFSLTNCTGPFLSGCYRAQKGRHIFCCSRI